MPVLAHDVYTNEPGAGPYVIFPTHAHQILSNCIHIVGVSILSYCFARRTENDRFTSYLWWSNLSWARLLVIIVFLDSWVFLAFSGILINGVGLSFSVPVCSLGIFACVFFYAGSKALIYLFLVERVWVVCSAGKSVTRSESSIYRGCAIILFGYIAIFIVMILGRFATIREDGVCIIGLQSFATIPLLTYDLFINIFLTSMFLWVIYREESIGERLRRLARRTGLASAVALTTSCVNILMLCLLNGRQLGWVCLGSCAADVTVNALVLFWVTAGAARDPHWHGAWENKELGGYGHGEPHELPPLNYPVSFVRDPEMGLERVWTTETARPAQGSARAQSRAQTRLAELAETMHKRELSQGQGMSTKEENEEGHHADAEDEDGGSILEDTEWDITESACSDASTSTTTANLSSTPWRLTLDLELEHPPPLTEHSHSEPDSPATHETAGSSRRLTRSLAASERSAQVQTQPKSKQPRHARQRQRQWHARPRPRRGCTRTSPTPPPEPPLRSTLSSQPQSQPQPPPPPLPSTQGSRNLMLGRSSDPLVQTPNSCLHPGVDPHKQ